MASTEILLDKAAEPVPLTHGVSAHSPSAAAPEKQDATREGLARLRTFGSEELHRPLLVLLPDQ